MTNCVSNLNSGSIHRGRLDGCFFSVEILESTPNKILGGRLLPPRILPLDLGVSRREHSATEAVKLANSASTAESEGAEGGSTSIRSVATPSDGAQVVNTKKKPSRYYTSYQICSFGGPEICTPCVKLYRKMHIFYFADSALSVITR